MNSPEWNFYDLLPKPLHMALHDWNSKYWESKSEYESMAHGMSRVQFNKLGADLAKQVKKVLPHLEVRYQYFESDFASSNSASVEESIEL